MKYQVSTFFLVLIMSISITLISSCKKDNDSIDPIIGKWNVDKQYLEIIGGTDEFIQFMSSEYGYSSDQAQELLDSYLSEFSEGYDSSDNFTMTFNADNTFIVDGDDDGTWVKSSDGKTLTIIFDGENTDFSIRSITNNSLVLSIPPFDEGEFESPFTLLEVEVVMNLSK